jgi:hypothetical protein
MLRCVTLGGTDVSEELITSIIGVIRIGELGAKLTVTSNQRTLRRSEFCYVSPTLDIQSESLFFKTPNHLLHVTIAAAALAQLIPLA